MDISYINNVYSEYIGTKIFELCGFVTQEVELGIYNEKFENPSIDPNPFKRELKDIFHISDKRIHLLCVLLNRQINKLKQLQEDN